jgi:antitoxin component of RelBE/YafQ-DinJ toxin-antitoxin module
MEMEIKEMPDRPGTRFNQYMTIRVDEEIKKKYEKLNRMGKDAAEVVRIAIRKAFEKVPL